MKATKKIVGAACALVAAVALSAGSTFAWFTSNGTVKATGLTVDVNTTNSYLVIGNELNELRPTNPEDTNFAYKTNIYLTPTTVDDEGNAVAGTAVKLLPAAYETTTTYDENDATCITKVGQWYTGEGTSPTNGALKGDKKPLDAWGDYVVMDDIYISVAESSEAVDSVKMTIAPASGSAWTTKNAAITVVVLYQAVAFDGSLATWSHLELNSTNNHGCTAKDIGGVSETTYIHVKVMVYLDGNHVDVRSANAKNLEGVALDFTFTDGSDSANSGTETEETP